MVVVPSGVGNGFLTIYPWNVSRPTVVSGNYAGGQIIYAPVTSKLGPAGAVRTYASVRTHVIFDAVAFIS